MFRILVSHGQKKYLINKDKNFIIGMLRQEEPSDHPENEQILEALGIKVNAD